MNVVDTNVVSEPMKTGGNPVVQAWLDCQIAETLCLTATSLSERPAGIESLPAGRRKDGLGDAWAIFSPACSGAHPAVRSASRRHLRRGGGSRSRGRPCHLHRGWPDRCHRRRPRLHGPFDP